MKKTKVASNVLVSKTKTTYGVTFLPFLSFFITLDIQFCTKFSSFFLKKKNNNKLIILNLSPPQPLLHPSLNPPLFLYFFIQEVDSLQPKKSKTLHRNSYYFVCRSSFKESYTNGLLTMHRLIVQKSTPTV